MKSKTPAILAFATVVCAAALVAVFALPHGKQSDAGTQAVVSVVDGTQIIQIQARDGYQPSSVSAKAGMPTVLRFVTSGNYDCSSSISIPALSYRGNLPPTGSTDIDVPAQQSGATVRGTCSMGMFSFTIHFT